MPKRTDLMEVYTSMTDTLADILDSLTEEDVDMAGDHALTMEELAQEFQRKAAA